MSKVLSPREVGEQLGCGTDYVYSLIGGGSLRASNIGSGKKRPLWRIEQSEVDEFIARRRKQTKPRAKSVAYQCFGVKRHA